MSIKNIVFFGVSWLSAMPGMATCVSIGAVNPRCEGIPFPLKATVTCGQTLSQTWYTLGDGVFSSLNDTQTVYYPGPNERFKGSFRVGFKVKFAAGLEDSSSATGKINFIPTGDITGHTSGCEPFFASFNGNFLDADSIIWNFGDGSLSYKGSEKCGHVYYNARATPYDVSVRLVSQFGCDTVLAKPGFVQVNISPDANFKMSTHQVVYPSSPVVTFQNHSDLKVLPPDSVTFKWYRNGIFVGINNQSTFAYAFTTGPNGKNTISLKIETKQGCSSEYIDYLFVYGTDLSTGINLPDVFERNSSEKNLEEIKRQLTQFHQFSIQVFNLMGQEMLKMNRTEDLNLLLLLPNGNYVLQVIIPDAGGALGIQRAKVLVTE